MADDLYDVLGVAHDTSAGDIRGAYRRLARQYHPDVNPGNAEAEARFKEINAAYEVLSDSEDRKNYDRYGDQWQHADEIEEMRRRSGGAGASRGHAFEFDLGDLLGGRDRGRGGGLFDSLFRRAAGRRRGQDVDHTVRVSLEEAYGGGARTVEVRDESRPCPVCGGAGQLASATCHACRGSGVAASLQRIEVKIPAGVESGTRIRVAGKGGPGANGGANGDLFLRVHVNHHPRFERRGDDLHIDVEVPVADAALGGEVHVPSLKGKTLAVRIPAGTQSSKVFRLAGQGMPRRKGGYGDLLARVGLVLPEPVTDKQRALFERLRATAGEEAEVTP